MYLTVNPSGLTLTLMDRVASALELCGVAQEEPWGAHTCMGSTGTISPGGAGGAGGALGSRGSPEEQGEP